MTNPPVSAFLGAALLIVAAPLVALALLWRHQERLVFQPPRPVILPPLDPRVRHVAYTAVDAQPLHAYLVGIPDPGSPLVIAFHGNAELAEWMVPWALELHTRTRATVLLPEYRGYGALSGRPTYAAARADALAAFTYAQSAFRSPPARLVLFGHSLGSAVAVELAAVARPAALVLQAPFTSARAMAARLLVPTFTPVWQGISRVHYDTVARVGQLEMPVHVAHGMRDRIVPAAMGRAVHAAARKPGELLLVPDAGHNDVPERAPERYWRWLVHAVAPGLR